MLKINDLVECYQYDQHGHFCGLSSAQVVKADDVCVLTDDIKQILANRQIELKEGAAIMMPPDCVLFAPEGKEGYWYDLNDEKTAWEAVKKPTTAAECVGMFIEHEDQCEYAHECRRLFEELCAASDGKYQVTRDDNLTLTVEAVPEPTAEETAAEAAEQALTDFDADLQALKDRMVIAQLNGDTELIAELQAEYKALMEVE